MIIFIHSFQLLFRDCNYPRGFMWWIGFHAILFWFLFMDFYKNTYSHKKQEVKSLNHFMACSQTEKLLNGFNKDYENDLSKLVKRRNYLNDKNQSFKNGFLNSLNFNDQVKGSKDF